MSDFQLIGAQFFRDTVDLYRLRYQLTSLNLVQTVYVQLIGLNSYKLIDSNYSTAELTSSTPLQTVSSLSILDDVWLHKINNIILNQYADLLGAQPSILRIAQRPPFYKLTYQAGGNTYTFIILYDYFQNRIIRGNITIN